MKFVHVFLNWLVKVIVGAVVLSDSASTDYRPFCCHFTRFSHCACILPVGSEILEVGVMSISLYRSNLISQACKRRCFFFKRHAQSEYTQHVHAFRGDNSELHPRVFYETTCKDVLMFLSSLYWP